MNDLILSAGRRLGVRFVRRGDRWQHTVDFRSSGRLVWQLDSDDLNEQSPFADDSWPASPPFQSVELHAEPGGRQFALLVGMAGASHWSASVEADAVAERIVFDVACRIKLDPKWLGSSYIVSVLGGKESTEAEGAAGQPSVGWPKIEAVAISASADEPEASVSAEGRRILICASDRRGALPRTVRWKYSISADSPRGG